MEWSETPHPYEVLGLAQGPASTLDEIKKAYRNQARIKHPDKQKNNPNAAAEFQALQQAYDLLNDKAAREALDAYLGARAARHQREAGQDEKRRKLREELERRERRATQERSEEEVARANLQVELSRLRQMAAEQQRQQREAAAAARAAAAGHAPAVSPAHAEAAEDIQQQLRRTLKVSWSATVGEYTPDELRAVFAAFGRVEDVVVRQRKKQSKGSALVVMTTEAAALSAANAACGSLQNPLLVLPLSKSAAAATATDPAAAPVPAAALDRELPSPQPSPSAAPSCSPAQAPAAAPPPPAGPAFPAAAHHPTGSSQRLFPVASSTFPTPSPSSSFPPVAFPGSSSFPTSGFGSFPSAGSRPANGGSGGLAAQETLLLEKMRRAAERERLLAQLKAEEAAQH